MEGRAAACFHMHMLKVSREYGMVKNCTQYTITWYINAC